MSNFFQNRTYNFILKEVTISASTLDAPYTLLPQSIGELNIFEGLTFPAIMGSISIADWTGLHELVEITGLDDIKIVFATEGEPDMTLQYKIYGASTSVQVGNTYHPITYYFCSEWLIDALTIQFSDIYIEKYIHEIWEDILKKCGASIGYIEPTKQKLNRFMLPLWTPIRSISHLCSFALNKEDKAGYIIWTDINSGKVNITTLDYLFRGNYGKDVKPYLSLPQNQFYENRIVELNVDDAFDVLKYGNLGIGKQHYQGFDFDRNEIITSNTNVNDIPYTHLGKHLSIDNKFLTDKYSNIKGCYLFPWSTGKTKNTEVQDIIDGVAKYKYVSLFADYLKLNIITNPSSNRKVGTLCNIEYQSTDKTVVTTNKIYSGTYLIRNIRHMIVNSIYEPIMTVISDGIYDTRRTNFISWRR